LPGFFTIGFRIPWVFSGFIPDSEDETRKARKTTSIHFMRGWPQKAQKPQIDGNYHPLILWDLCFLWQKLHRLKTAATGRLRGQAPS